MAKTTITSRITELAENLRKLSLLFDKGEITIEELLNSSRELHELIVHYSYEIQKESQDGQNDKPNQTDKLDIGGESKEETIDETIETVETNENTTTHEKPIYNKEDANTINTKLRSDEAENWGSTLNKKPIANLRTDIGINERFFLIKELFSGSAEAFNNTIDVLEGCSSRKEAIDCFNNNLAQKYGWKDESEALDVFLNLLTRRHLV